MQIMRQLETIIIIHVFTTQVHVQKYIIYIIVKGILLVQHPFLLFSCSSFVIVLALVAT